MTDPQPEELTDVQQRFEDFDYDGATAYEAGDPNTPPDVLLTRALASHALYQRRARTVMRDAVDAARAHGLSWHQIGLALGITGETARKRYATHREDA